MPFWHVYRLKLEGEELAKFGPAKPIDQQGIDEYADQAIQKGRHYQQDPTGRRTGEGAQSLRFPTDILFDKHQFLCLLLVHVDAAGPDPVAAKTLLRTLEDAQRLAHKVFSACA